MAATCSGCQKSWHGTTASHCRECHRTFSCDSAGDRHRVGPYTPEGRVCRPPASIGLVEDERGVWKWARTLQPSVLDAVDGASEGSGSPEGCNAPSVPHVAEAA